VTLLETAGLSIANSKGMWFGVESLRDLMCATGTALIKCIAGGVNVEAATLLPRRESKQCLFGGAGQSQALALVWIAAKNRGISLDQGLAEGWCITRIRLGALSKLYSFDIFDIMAIQNPS